nr:hypothetical protein [Brucella intermedia]
MTDLITSLSKLDAPDREVDALIAAELEPHIFDAPGFNPVRPVPSFRIGSEGNTIRFEDGGIMCLSYFPRYTASVDAAIALAERVLPGWVFDNVGQDFHSVPGGYEAFGWNVELINGTRVQGQAPTLPLAICIALLRAKEASK